MVVPEVVLPNVLEVGMVTEQEDIVPDDWDLEEREEGDMRDGYRLSAYRDGVETAASIPGSREEEEEDRRDEQDQPSEP